MGLNSGVGESPTRTPIFQFRDSALDHVIILASFPFAGGLSLPIVAKYKYQSINTKRYGNRFIRSPTIRLLYLETKNLITKIFEYRAIIFY